MIGERRDLNPRMVESQPTALTTWPHPPNYLPIIVYQVILNNVYVINKIFNFLTFFDEGHQIRHDRFQTTDRRESSSFHNLLQNICGEDNDYNC